jgi:hypothetical protein
MPASKAITDAVGFFLELARKWGALVSGAFSVPFTLLGFLTDRSYQQTVWWGMAAAALLFSYFLDHQKQRATIKELVARLSPKIRLFLHRDTARGTMGIEIGRGPHGEELPYVQVSAEALTDELVYDCAVSMNMIEHRTDGAGEFTEVWTESRPLPWIRRPHSTNLSKGNPIRFNIVSSDPRIAAPLDIVPPHEQSNMLNQFYGVAGKNGEYRYTVHVVGRNAIPSVARIYVNWQSNNYPSVKLEPIEAD